MSLITELKQEREHFHPEVVQFKITIDELEKQNASLENDKKAITSQWEFERDKSQIALKESEAEKEKLNAMISEVQKVSLELEKKLEDSVQKCQAISSELKEEKISVSTEEYSWMKLAVSSMETELADLKAERTTLVQTMSELENARICLSSRLDEERGMSKKDLSILMSTVVELKNDIEYFQVEKNHLNEAINELKMKNTGLEEDRKASLSCQLEDEKHWTESLALKNQLTNSVQECQVLSTQLNEKNVKYLEMKSTISRLDEEVTYLENTKASLEMERDSISSSMMEEREKFHNECSVLTSSISELQTTVTNYEGKNNVLNKTVLELQSKNAHLENDMNIISSQLDAERVKSAKKNFELKSTISALQEESQPEKDQLKMTISAFQEESQAEKDHLKAAISELQNDTIEFKEKLDYTKQECQTVLSQLHKERESLNSYKLENSQMKSTILNKEKEIADLKAEIRNLANTLVESEYIRNDLEKGLADEREQFKKECSVLNSSVAELTQKLEHCENERSNLNQTIQELKTMIVHLEKDKEALSSQLEENWKLIKKIEPFRDVLDNFQMEKKFLLERDKYTSEQMERLTKEAIKNMGHQNHCQKVKYVETLKKIAPVIATTQCDSSKIMT
ncbi:hyaluronan-mediated motility receptor [Biomphalaria glabrata]|nr:hyaluronan-mediated motility receptor-like [Biomphalaria glabrata]